MKAFVPAYEMLVPKNLPDALRRLADDSAKLRPFAGGTDLMVQFEAGKLPPGRYLSLWKLKELRGIDVTAKRVTVGALTTYTDILRNTKFSREFPVLAAAARETGAVAIQNRGTLGGNIANASPAADTPPGLLVYDAEVGLVSASGTRWIPYWEFHLGYKKTALRPDELIGWVRLPRRTAAWTSSWRKVGTRRAQSISKVAFAGAALVKGKKLADVRIAYGSVAPAPLRCIRTEETLRGHTIDDKLIIEARRVLGTEIVPIDDIRSTSAYRLTVAKNLLAAFLEELL